MGPSKSPVEQFKSRDDFLRFVREVSPDADLNCVLLYGQINRAHHYLQQIMERRLESVGLTWAKMRLMMSILHSERLGQVEGLQPSELSEKQDISRNTVSALISALEKDGYITRQLHGQDRRKFLIGLTANGRTLLLAQMDEQFKYLSQIFDPLSARERQTLLDLLLALNSSLKEQSRQGRADAGDSLTAARSADPAAVVGQRS